MQFWPERAFIENTSPTFLVENFSLTISRNLVTLSRKKSWTDYFGGKKGKNQLEL